MEQKNYIKPPYKSRFTFRKFRYKQYIKFKAYSLRKHLVFSYYNKWCAEDNNPYFVSDSLT